MLLEQYNTWSGSIQLKSSKRELHYIYSKYLGGTDKSCPFGWLEFK